MEVHREADRRDTEMGGKTVASVPRFDVKDGPGATPVELGMTVDRRSGIGVAEFIAEYRDPRRPVILTDAARDWPLYGRGTPEYFRREYGSRIVRVRGRDYTIGELIELLEASTVEQPGPYPC